MSLAIGCARSESPVPNFPPATTVVATQAPAKAAAEGVQGQAGNVESRPLSPRDSLAQIVLEPGVAVTLVASEPNILDPVAARFDEEGRLWVVQMRDYPTGATKEFPSKSRISILRDINGDGFYETATVFADDLTIANGVQPWKGGVFVTMAGELAYMKDTDGDDRADLRETWYTGFSLLNEQLRANHPRLALDNHIHVAAGLRGGTILDAQNPKAPPISISGMDFRFDPLTRSFEAATGEAQFGLTFDDYGNRFVCANRDPAIHMVLDDFHLKKNPLVSFERVLEHVIYGDYVTPIYPIARTWTTYHHHVGQFTAACGIEIYRGDVLPPAWYGNVFVCEPTGYLVHRESIRPNGVSFAESFERGRAEFLASRDLWFRPVNLEVGPDGALYVVDMYRQIIEHPEWMPEELRDRPNLRAGNDRGRIYRVAAQGMPRRPSPSFAGKSNVELVEMLGASNSWQRETAARLLLERQDPSIAHVLRQVARQHDSPLARIHAVRLLEGLRLLDDQLLAKLCDDADPRIVEQAIIAADSLTPLPESLRAKIGELVDSPDSRVRFQAYLVALPLPQPPRYATDAWEENAMLIAAGRRGGEALRNVLENSYRLHANATDPEQFVVRLSRLAAASRDPEQSRIALDALMASPVFRRAGVAGLFGEAARQGLSSEELCAPLDASTRARVEELFAAARLESLNTALPLDDRCEAIDLLACSAEPATTLLPLVLEDRNQAIRLRAVRALTRCDDLQAWKALLAEIAKLSPVLRRAVLDGVYTNPDRTNALLDLLENEQLKMSVLDPAGVQLLLNHAEPTIKQRSEKLLATLVPADREEALATYRKSLDMKHDPRRGRAVFEKTCAACHRVAGVGVSFAPDISHSGERTPLQILTDIIQPNRAVDANYISYTLTTTDGQAFTGVLSAETSTSVTIRRQELQTETFRREEIDELRSNSVSFMPEGLEKNLSLQEMADLIGFIKNWRYLDNPVQAPAAKP
ncbi:MAG: c-type cytochrome [Pirellulales bacterium]|nr:c-type cytochrome [Pirellulales bacterium]